MATKEIVIKDWQEGIADSPHLGLGLLRNADIESFPGSIRPSKKLVTMFRGVTAGRTFTVDTGTDIGTASGTLQSTGVEFTCQGVTFTTTGTLPAGLTTGTQYYLIRLSTTTFRVASTWANALSGVAIDITTTGTGVHTIVPTPIGTINWIVKHPRLVGTGPYLFALDSNGRVWFTIGEGIFYPFSSQTQTLTDASGNGIVLFANSATPMTSAMVSRTFTAVAATDIMTAPGNVTVGGGTDYTGQAVYLTNSGGALPAGLSLNTEYFFIAVTASTFKLAASRENAFSGTAIDITDAGTGTHTYVPLPDKVYMFVFRNNAIDYVDVTSDTFISGAGWVSGWKTMNTPTNKTYQHHAIVGQDNLIYFTDSRFVGSIMENPGSVFEPTLSYSYTYNNQALDIPQGEVLQTLEELGVDLLVGSNTSNKIYPWDRVSDSFELPLTVPEHGIKRLVNMGSVVYILAGTKGNVYSTQGTYVRLFKELPDYIMNNTPTLTANPVTWGGAATRTGALIFGAVGQTSGSGGVYLLYPDGRLVQDNTPSAGTQNVTAIFAENDFYTAGYAGGFDVIDASQQDNLATVLHSSFYTVSDKTMKATFSEIEAQLTRPGVAGQLRLKYRTTTTGSFSNFPSGTVDFFTSGTTTSFTQDIGLIDIENIQIQAEMNGNIDLLYIRLIP